MKEIVQKENPVLREKSVEVPHKDITSDTVKSVLKDMYEALKEKGCGVALAAPQIGMPLRIFIVSNKVFEDDGNCKKETDDEINEGNKKEDNLVYINPKIIKSSKKTCEIEEACLSVEGYFGIVTRAKLVTVEAYDESGVKFTRGASGLLAQIFQHEIEHLNGMLYIDHARDIQKVEIKKDEK